MVALQLRRPVAPGDVKVLRDLADAAERTAGHPVIGDAVWLDLAEPSPDTALVVASDDTGPVGAMHVGPGESLSTPHTRLSFAVTPEAPAAEVVGALTNVALEDVRVRGGGAVELWMLGAEDAWDAIVRPLGLERSRELWQLRVPLPAAAPLWPPGIDVATFEPRRDEAAWLAVNNRAFEHDPDQGGWTEAALRRRQHEAWFDPRGFLLARDQDGLAGFCWTKLHPPSPPVEPEPVGEIYVIGVDPDRTGVGLGRALVLAGLADLHDRKGAPVGMLFVDATNTAALALYRSVGFTLARVDRAYAGQC